MSDLNMEIFNLLGLFPDPDQGGVVSFIATAAIVLVVFVLKFRAYENPVERLKNFLKDGLGETEFSWTVIALATALIGLTALWLAIRVTLLYVERYLTVEKYAYIIENIFVMVAYALAANLCFTLVRAFSRMGRKTEIDTRQLINVGVQAVLIGLIILVPRAAEVLFPAQAFDFGIDRSIAYVLVFIGMTIAVVILLFSRERLTKSDRTIDVSSEKPSKMFCRYCGTEILPGSVFCEACGKKVTGPP